MAGSLLSGKYRVQPNTEKLNEYYQKLFSEYGTDLSMQEEFLDNLEEYICENRKNLGIKYYERESDCVIVKFEGGISLVLKPQAEGFD